MPSLPQIPGPLLERGRRWLPSMIWAVPAMAAIIGLSLVIEALFDRGPTITLSFVTAEGIEPGKTKVKFKNVDVGEVKSVRLNDNRSRVMVTVELSKDAESFAASDSRFWVVRPRFAGSGVSGLSTLVSGAYIGVDAGHNKLASSFFVGREDPPVVTSDVPGRRFVLQADDIGSLDIGSPIYYRRLQVGQVMGFALDPDGRRIKLQIFVRAPYDKFITADTRFWHASGIDLQFDAGGVRLETQSLLSIVFGGVAFETLSLDGDKAESAEGDSFTLAANRGEAMRRSDIALQQVTLRFHQSVRGLSPGAPVDFRGIEIGSVESIDLVQDPTSQEYIVPVVVRIDPSRLATRNGKTLADASADQAKSVVDSMVRRGLRAQLRTGNLLAGQLYVAFDFFPDATPVQPDAKSMNFEIPTVPGDIEALQQQLVSIIRKLDKVPFDQLGDDLHHTLAGIEETMKHVDALAQSANGELVPEVREALVELRHTLDGVSTTLAGDSPVQQDTRQALRNLTEATRSLKTLSDTLERHPESLVRGKKGDDH